MWKCHKCGKPVYFAERKQSLGYDWHPECLRCEECGKRLNPGLHAEHKGVPYCHVPCYGALFGPQLFGHGTRVESHKSFGDKQRIGGAGGGNHAAGGPPALPRDHIESKLRVYNQYHSGQGSHEIRCREVNERLVLEGALRVCWGVQGMIHLKEDDDQRTVITVRKRNSCRYNLGDAAAAVAGGSSAANHRHNDDDDEEDARNDDDYYHDPEPAEEAALDLNGTDFNTATYVKEVHSAANDDSGGNDSTDISLTDSMSYDTCAASAAAQTAADDRTSCGSSMNASPENQPRSYTLPGKIEQIEQLQWDDLDELLQVERRVDDAAKPYRTMPTSLMSASTVTSPSRASTSMSGTSATTPDDSSRTLTRDLAADSLPLSSNGGGSSGDSSSATTTTTSSNAATSTTATATTTTTASTSSSSEEYVTPSSTLKNVDYDLFRVQMHEEYMTNSQQLQSLGDGTLRSHQPIDPSRINDSLKLYSDQLPLMSQSFCGAEPALRECSALPQHQTLQRNGPIMQRTGRYALQKNSSAGQVPTATALQNSLNRSRSGPNWFEANSNADDADATLKPSAIRKQQQLLELQSQQQEQRQLEATVASPADESEDKRSTAATMASSFTSTTTCGSSLGLPNGDSLTASTSAFTTPTTETSVGGISDSLSADTSTTTANNHDDCSTGHCHLPRSRPQPQQQQQQQQHSDATNDNSDNAVVLRRPKQGSTAIKRRSGNKRSRAKLKRRCSINGHFYNRETSFFTPPHGSQMSVWVTSLVSTADVIQLLLEKYKVDSQPTNFALYVVRDNGEQKRLRDDEYPLVTRVMMGPHEEVARLFLMDAQSTTEISSDVAQYLNLSLPECRSIIDRFNAEQERETQKIREKYAELRNRIVQRMESLKVRL